MTALEAGAKYRSGDDRLTAEFNLFNYDFADYQSTALLNVGGFDTNVRANVADAVITGAELSAALALHESLAIQAGVAYLDTKIEDFRGVQEGVEGNELPFAPEFSWNTALVYSAQISGDMSIKVQLDASGTGSHFQTINNNDKVESYVVGNFRVGVESPDWAIGLWVRNLSDEIYDVGFFPGGGLAPDSKFKGPPRSYGMNLRYRF